jgi:predicted DNA-binding protein (UPF0251 family)
MERMEQLRLKATASFRAARAAPSPQTSKETKWRRASKTAKRVASQAKMDTKRDD